jgi:hypothetical protein
MDREWVGAVRARIENGSRTKDRERIATAIRRSIPGIVARWSARCEDDEGVKTGDPILARWM